MSIFSADTDRGTDNDKVLFLDMVMEIKMDMNINMKIDKDMDMDMDTGLSDIEHLKTIFYPL